MYKYKCFATITIDRNVHTVLVLRAKYLPQSKVYIIYWSVDEIMLIDMITSNMTRCNLLSLIFTILPIKILICWLANSLWNKAEICRPIFFQIGFCSTGLNYMIPVPTVGPVGHVVLYT